MWKLTLLGYREKDVETYIHDIAKAREAEIAALEERIRLAEDTNRRREALLTDLRSEAYRRRAQLDAVEKELVQMYHRAVQTQLSEAADQAAAEQNAGSATLRRQENRKMKKYPSLNTSLLGVSQKELDRYLAIREKEHRATIADLTEKLRRLEEAVTAQTDEMKVLEELMHRPELQQPFIDLAYRYLDRLEKAMTAAARAETQPNYTGAQSNRRTAAGRAAGARSEGTPIPGPEGSKPIRVRPMAARQAATKLTETKPEAARQTIAVQAATGSAATEPAEAGDRAPMADESAAPVFSTVGGGGGTIHSLDSAFRSSRRSVRYPERMHMLQYNYLAGKTAGEDVVGRRGELLLGKGEKISAESAERIREQGRIEQLVRSIEVIDI